MEAETLFFGGTNLDRKLSCLLDVGRRESTMPMPLKFLVDGAHVDGNEFGNHTFERSEYFVHCFVSCFH